MKFAVVEIAGKQHLVQEKEVLETQKLPEGKDDKVTFPRVLLYWDGKKIAVGRPYLDGFTVEGIIKERKRGPKLVVYKYRRRKNSSTKRGHRQDLCVIEIKKINAGGKTSAAAKTEKEGGKKSTPKKSTSAKPEKKAAAKKKTSSSASASESKKKKKPASSRAAGVKKKSSTAKRKTTSAAAKKAAPKKKTTTKSKSK